MIAVNVVPGRYLDPAIAAESLMTLVDSQRMHAVAIIKTEQWESGMVGKSATVTFRGKRYSAKVASIGLKREEKGDGLPAYELTLSFSADRLIPAGMPVSIEIDS